MVPPGQVFCGWEVFLDRVFRCVPVSSLLACPPLAPLLVRWGHSPVALLARRALVKRLKAETEAGLGLCKWLCCGSERKSPLPLPQPSHVSSSLGSDYGVWGPLGMRVGVSMIQRPRGGRNTSRGRASWE